MWYAGGLHFECNQCGSCCSGPGEGYIWLTQIEIDFICDYLKITPEQMQYKYLRTIGRRKSIVEAKPSNDCIFLEYVGGRKTCVIYPVRPNQCRTWPFWESNLSHPDSWNEAAIKCPGINRGKCHTLAAIEKQRDQEQWW